MKATDMALLQQIREGKRAIKVATAEKEQGHEGIYITTRSGRGTVGQHEQEVAALERSSALP